MIRSYATALAILSLFGGTPQSLAAGSPAQGQRVFGACAACHSLQPDQNMTGPSLAGVWNRKAGTLASFTRYSPAMKSANIEWNDRTLDEWIADPEHLIPGNQMTFDGIKDPRQRRFAGVLKGRNKAGGVRRAGWTNGRHGRGRHDGGNDGWRTGS